MSISVVITNYNRSALVLQSIHSVLKQPEFGLPHEIIVIDDASQDGSMSAISLEFQEELQEGLLRIYQNKINLGVTGSKNRGFRFAFGKWVIFLDSDDLLVESIWGVIESVLSTSNQYPIVFLGVLTILAIL